QAPLGRQRVRELENLDIVEGFFEDQQAVRLPELLDDAGPAVVGEGGAERHLKIGITSPEMTDRLNAVPARRHANIDERNRERTIDGQTFLDHRERLLALLRVGEFEVLPRRAGLRGVADELGAQYLQRRTRRRRSEDLAEVVVDRRHVVDDENAGDLGAHATDTAAPGTSGEGTGCEAGWTGRGMNRVKRAPHFNPSLSAPRLPPSVRAAMAPLCRPNP